MRRSGFTLVEVLVVMALMALLLVLGILQTHDATGRAGCRAAAEVVADELRSARQLAIGSGQPVAVAFPTESMSRPHSRSLYLLQGYDPPRILRVRNLERDYRDVCFFVGHWSLDPSKLRNPLLGNSMVQPPLASNWGDFDPASWQLPRPQDHVFVFSPGGQATSNLRPLFDGAYHLVVSRGIDYQAGSLGGRTSFLARAVCDPYTIAVSPAGMVEVSPGLTGSDGSVAIANSPPAAPAPPADPPAVPALPNQPPEIQKIQAFPAANPSTLPPGIDATVDLEGFLTLRVEAEDTDGDALFLQWSATNGAFSAAGQQPMQWDYRRGLWTSTWEWRPPKGVAPNQTFQLDCLVDDRRGGTDTQNFGVAGQVRTLKPGRVVFCSNRDGNWEIYVMNDDGTDQTNLTRSPAWDDRPRWSPDGSKILFVSNRTGLWQVYTMNADGTDLRQLTSTPGWDATYPHWSQDGTRITYSTGPGAGSYDVWIMNADGTDPQLFYADGAWDGPTGWSPDGKWLAEMHWAWHGSWDFDLYLLDKNGNLLGNLTDAPEGQNDCFWSPDGTRIAFNQTTAAGQSDACYAFLDDTVNPTRLTTPYVMLTNDPTWDGCPVWNYDGTRLAFPSARSGNKDIWAMKSDGTGLTQLTSDPADDDWPHWWGK